jgi:hypothetical protein
MRIAFARNGAAYDYPAGRLFSVRFTLSYAASKI